MNYEILRIRKRTLTVTKATLVDILEGTDRNSKVGKNITGTIQHLDVLLDEVTNDIMELKSRENNKQNR